MLTPTPVFDSYWRFAAKRHAMYERRLTDPAGPWTQDPILRNFRFTNAYRAADRVSQYLIGEVQYRLDRSQVTSEIFFRTMLFKLFNKIETWQLIESQIGPVSWQSVDLAAIDAILDQAIRSGRRIYSAAYIMPAPPFGRARKHSNHLALLERMMQDGLPARIERALSLAEVYELILGYPSLGRFLAFQYTIDLNYSRALEFDEQSFVVAGPGALDGISKCFLTLDGRDAETVIHTMVDEQESHFERLSLSFSGLFGRRLQPIDCQNLFCEIGKYSRVAHPEVSGTSGRTRIKQGYAAGRPLSQPLFPPRWGLAVPDYSAVIYAPRQGALL